MIRVLIDTNIFLNVAREEPKFLSGSERLLRKIAVGEIEALASSVVLMEIKWALHQKGESAKADRAVSLIEELVKIASVDKETAKQAIDMKISKRLELLDAVHVATAVIESAIFVTRDQDLRRRCEDTIAIRSPEELLKQIRVRE